MTLKAAIYDPYLNTLGGGERYCLTVGEILLKNGYDVDIFWSGDQEIIKKAETRFNLDIRHLRLVPDIFHVAMDELSLIEDTESLKNTVSHPRPQKGVFGKVKNLFSTSKITKQYDLIFYLSDGSIPILFGKNNLLHAQVPLKLTLPLPTRILNTTKLHKFSRVVCNSRFTAKVIDNLYSLKSLVVYPPVDVDQFKIGKKEKIIISVGRFDNILNAKKQDVLIQAFRKLSQNFPSKGWKLFLAGGSTQQVEKNSYLNHLKKISEGLSVEYYVNPDFGKLKELYSTASIYWHAAGFEVDENLHPENTEHFGITVVEAMASGAVPIVVSKGGLPEIVNPNQNGYLWSTIDELVSKTQLLISYPDLLKKYSEQSLIDSVRYSKENFENEILKLLQIK